MAKEKILKIEEGVLTYFLMQHIFRTKVDITFTKEYLRSFLNGFFLNSAKNGYTLLDRNEKEVDVSSKEFPNFVKNTADMICYKYGKLVDDFFGTYCIAHEFVHPLRWLYDVMSTEMTECIIDFENALTLDAFFNDDNLKIIEDEYYSQSERMQKKLEKEQKKKEDADEDIYAKA